MNQNHTPNNNPEKNAENFKVDDPDTLPVRPIRWNQSRNISEIPGSLATGEFPEQTPSTTPKMNPVPTTTTERPITSTTIPYETTTTTTTLPPKWPGPDVPPEGPLPPAA